MRLTGVSAKTCFLGRINCRQDAESEYRRRPLEGGKINKGTHYDAFTTLQENQPYQDVQRQIGNQIELFDKLNLDKEQWLIVDRLVSLHTESGALYGRIAYQQGYRDCAAILQAMNLIKAS